MNRIGYASINHSPEGTRFLDWGIITNESNVEDRKVQRFHDREGWYEYATNQDPFNIVHVKIPLRAVYYGNHPDYITFKST